MTVTICGGCWDCKLSILPLTKFPWNLGIPRRSRNRDYPCQRTPGLALSASSFPVTGPVASPQPKILLARCQVPRPSHLLGSFAGVILRVPGSSHLVYREPSAHRQRSFRHKTQHNIHMGFFHGFLYMWINSSKPPTSPGHLVSSGGVQFYQQQQHET